MNRLDELEAKLRREAESWQPSPDLEAKLLRDLGHAHFMRVLRVLATAAIAAMLLFVFWPKPKPAVKPEPQIARVVQQEPVTQAVAAHPISKRKPRLKTPQPSAPEFIRIPYSAPLEANERAEVVRVELPVAALTATGLHIASADTGARAQADLIVGEDGMARAVRLISILNNQ